MNPEFKLGLVDHIRCGESQVRNYVWVPLDWDEDKFARAVHDAKEAYDADRALYLIAKEQQKFSSHKTLEYRLAQLDQSMTIADAIAKLEAEAASDKKVDAALFHGYKTFQEYLEEQGMISFWNKFDPEFEEDINWGHNHGTSFNYSDDDTWKDKSSPSITLARSPEDDPPELIVRRHPLD